MVEYERQNLLSNLPNTTRVTRGCERLPFLFMRIEICFKLSIPLPMIVSEKVVIGISGFPQFYQRRRAY